MAQISYDNKVALYENSDIANINKVKAEAMNEIKSVVNENATTLDTYISKIDNLRSYSTNETVIGTWIDGKPIYRKVVDCGNLPNATNKQVNHGISNLKKVINVYGIMDYNNGFYNTFPCIKTNNYFAYIEFISNTQIRLTTTTNESGTTVMLIMEYTKTTD